MKNFSKGGGFFELIHSTCKTLKLFQDVACVKIPHFLFFTKFPGLHIPAMGGGTLHAVNYAVYF
jgi:hypothetical protein